MHGLCNVSCIFCSDFKRYSRSTYQNVAYKIILQRIENLEQVVLAGGDPFYNPSINSLLIAFKDNNIKAKFWTNLNYLDSSTKNILRDIHLISIHVSINAASQDVYEKIVRGGKWDVLLNNLQFIHELRKEKKFNLTTSMVVYKYNYMQISDFIRFSFFDNNATAISLHPMVLHSNNHSCKLDDKQKEVVLEELNILESMEFAPYKRKISYLGLKNAYSDFSDIRF